MDDELSKKFEVLQQLVSQADDHEVRWFSTIFKLTKNGVALEGDTKHDGIHVKEWGLDSAQGVDTKRTTDRASFWRRRPPSGRQ